MTEKASTRVLERIRKMLALAENSGATPAEAATAAGMAAKTMAKYNLDHADVMLEQLEDDDIVATDSSRQQAMPQWMNSLCVPTAHLHDCEVRFNWKMEDGKRWTTYGEWRQQHGV